MQIEHVAVVGAGTMGNGIAHVFAQHGHRVTLLDLDQDRLDRGLATIEKNLARQVKKDVLTAKQQVETLARIACGTGLAQGVQ
ncbi:MAG: 3-hydroxyacyl-CoA dehydrogenase NAD-binding domain-containing protein, partial [Bacteroidota bacterium]